MPTYDYHCEKCGRDFTAQATVEKHVKHEVKCPKCGSSKLKHRLERFFAKTSRKS